MCHTMHIAIMYICNFVVFHDLAAGRDYTTVSQEIVFSAGHSKVFVMIPLIDNAYNRQRDVFFYVDIIFNTSIIARSTVTIVDDEYGELTISVTIVLV